MGLVQTVEALAEAVVAAVVRKREFPAGGGVRERCYLGDARGDLANLQGVTLAECAPVQPRAGPRREFLELATGSVLEVDRTVKAPDVTIPSLSVSPNGQRILYAQYDQSGSNILMVEGFR
jgi:hypothetical protein